MIYNEYAKTRTLARVPCRTSQSLRQIKSSISEHTFPALGMAGTQDGLLYNPHGIPHDTHHLHLVPVPG